MESPSNKAARESTFHTGCEPRPYTSIAFPTGLRPALTKRGGGCTCDGRPPLWRHDPCPTTARPSPRCASSCARLRILKGSEEHTYALQSLMRLSYADFCLN